MCFNQLDTVDTTVYESLFYFICIVIFFFCFYLKKLNKIIKNGLTLV